MKYEITGKWTNGFKNDAVLFFAQTIEKLLNSKTDHVNCLPVLNSYSLLYEYLNTFNLVENDLIDKKHLDYIAEEISESLEQDVIVNTILNKNEIAAIKKKFNSVPSEEKKTIIFYLVNKLYKFNEKSKEYLLTVIVMPNRNLDKNRKANKVYNNKRTYTLWEEQEESSARKRS